MDDTQIGWIAAIIVGGVAGWLAEQFMKSEMGILMKSGRDYRWAVASAISNFLGRPRRTDRLPDRRVHRRGLLIRIGRAVRGTRRLV